MCISWCADEMTVRDARCNGKDNLLHVSAPGLPTIREYFRPKGYKPKNLVQACIALTVNFKHIQCR